MSYTLKFQSSSDLFKSVIRRTKGCKTIICGHCLCVHSKNIGRGYAKNASSTCLQPKKSSKSESVRKGTNTESLVKGNKKSKKFHQSSEGQNALKNENAAITNQTIDVKSHFYYNSSKSYDSTLLVPNGSIFKFVENLIDGTAPPNLDLKNAKESCDTISNEISSYLNSNMSEVLSDKSNNQNNLKTKKTVSDVTDQDVVSNLELNNYFEKRESTNTVPSKKFQNVKNQDNFNEKYDNSKNSLKTKYKNYVNTKLENELGLDNMYSQFKKMYLGPKSLSEISTDTGSNLFELVSFVQAYVDVCVTNNMPSEGLNALKTCTRRLTWRKISKHSFIVEAFNNLLFNYAEDWNAVVSVTKMMKTDGTPFNFQTYAILLDSLARNKQNGNLSCAQFNQEIIELLNQIKLKEIDLNDVFLKAVITKKQCENILFCIRTVIPDFERAPIKTNLNHNAVLLKDLINNSQTLESQLNNDFSSEDMSKLIDQQFEIEKKFVIEIEPIKVDGVGVPTAEEAATCAELKEHWRNVFHKGFVNNIQRADVVHANSRACFNLTVFLKSLPVESMVDTMLNCATELISYCGGYSPNIKILQKNLGEQIYLRYQAKRKYKYGVADTTKDIYKKYCDWFLQPTGVAKNSRQQWQMLVQECGDGNLLNIRESKWPESVKLGVGKFLYDIIFNNAKIMINDGKKGRNVPVFYCLFRRNKSVCLEEVKCHPKVTQMFLKCGFDKMVFSASSIPMICPPKPWRSVTQGGYVISPVDYTRPLREAIGKRLDFNKIPVEQFYPTFDSLNAIQAVPWTVNKDVLDVALELFKNGGHEKLDVPEYPNMDPITLNITESMTPIQRSAEYTKKKIIMRERQNQYGLWCEALYRLSLANHFRDKIFWLPQNFDFRGRVYPVSPHLNHIGGDLFRSLLIFGKGKPLGPKGFDWLKIHTINLTGSHKRESVADRLAYANTILPEILDSAEKPLTGDKWWTNSEEPWQTLASCFEIKKVIESGDPENYVSKFPIHQDGSCNGLQHYAALGRDTVGAKSVNLTPCMAPQDVYSDVLDVIEKLRKEDAKNGIEIAQQLEGFIQRKIVKQTIMTSVYGVTFYGARLQIASKLEDLPDFPQRLVWTAAGYLTQKTFQSLEQMFSSAKQIQDWFIQCATIISNQNDYVQWVTPLGLPVLQPYAKKVYKKNEKNLKVSYYKPNAMKQRNAFPPNFVHSLDSTHMMLTAQFCEQAGLTFASIHDCYWTHPSTVEIMNKICRDQFISLYSQPILEDLQNFFVKHYVQDKDSEAFQVFSKVPEKGEFNITSVSDSIYFFS
ncbi:hypothetical protein RUM43_002211 [Polyplax serrata]|uniref:DNA-directed RNA polymerase n=1 Tax=Polyplax serrata TaxID=468196 RepID=A0AAN8NYH7_POLSC